MKPNGSKDENADQLFFKALESASLRMLITDSDGIIVYVNPSFLKSSGIVKDELVGGDISAFLVTDELKPAFDELKLYQKKGKTYNKKISVSYKNKPPLFHEVVIQPLGSGDNSTHFLFEFYEVSEATKREQKLKKLLNERETLIKEIHHRVKNNLAVISGLLTLQKYTYDDDRLFIMLSDCEMRIKSMALIHEKLYRSSSLSSIGISVYLEDLIQSIRETLTKRTNISIELNCESIQLDVNQAVPSALIVNEIISNSYKYAYPDNRKGMIRVNAFKDDNKIHFVVEDDGVGLPDDFEERRVSSLGYTIIDTLISQLEAELIVESNNGTRLHFSYEYKE